MLGTSLGNYRIVDKLAESSMGVVFMGRHETLSRRVVVKVLLPELSRNADMVQRFFTEAQAATAIRNPGIVQVIDFGRAPDGSAYFVMELLEGESLATRLRKRRLDAVECCRLGRQVANVLAAAHAVGITHRDLKPENLFLIPDPEVIGGERVKVLDFGIAKLASEAHASGMRTRTGLLLSSPTYMSPEQCRSFRTADARSDIYSLGCILFEVACGHPPFAGVGMGDIIGAHLHTAPPDLQQLVPNLPPGLSALIAKMLAKQPEARPQTMAEVSQPLDEVLRTLGPPPRAGTAPPVRAGTAPPVRAGTEPPVRAPSAPLVASASPAPARPPTPLPVPPTDLHLPEPTMFEPTLMPMDDSPPPPVPPPALPAARSSTPLPTSSPAPPAAPLPMPSPALAVALRVPSPAQPAPAPPSSVPVAAPVPIPAPVLPSAPAPVLPSAPAALSLPIPQLSPSARTIAASTPPIDARSRAAARRRGLVIGCLFVAVIITAVVISLVTGDSGPAERQVPYDRIAPSTRPAAVPVKNAAPSHR